MFTDKSELVPHEDPTEAEEEERPAGGDDDSLVNCRTEEAPAAQGDVTEPLQEGGRREEGGADVVIWTVLLCSSRVEWSSKVYGRAEPGL